MEIGISYIKSRLFLFFLLLTLYQKGDTFGMREYVAYDGQCFTVEWFYNERILKDEYYEKD